MTAFFHSVGGCISVCVAGMEDIRAALIIGFKYLGIISVVLTDVCVNVSEVNIIICRNLFQIPHLEFSAKGIRRFV